MQKEFKVYRYPYKDYWIEDINKIRFADEIYITYAVCSKQCGHTEFLVDGSSQNCKICGKQLFRNAIYEYHLEDGNYLEDKDMFNEKFPLNIYNIDHDGFFIKRKDIGWENTGYDIEDYIEVIDEEVEFPESIYIGFAVSSKQCQSYEYVAENSSQICEYCGKQLLCLKAGKYKRGSRLRWNSKLRDLEYVD